MEFIAPLPRTAFAGSTIPEPVILRLRTTDTDLHYAAIADSPNLLAVVTLLPGPHSTDSSDLNVLHRLLSGQCTASVHTVADDIEDGSIASTHVVGPQGFGYISFPGLSVRQAGTFRLHVALLHIADGAVIQVVDSNPFDVEAQSSTSTRQSHDWKCDGPTMLVRTSCVGSADT